MATTKISSSFTFSLYISLSLLSLTSAFSPTDHYLINCGSRAAETLDSDHRVFAGDHSRFPASTRSIQFENLDSDRDSHSPIYSTARAFNQPLHYTFWIKDQETTTTHHLVRLHFHPLRNQCNNFFESQFHVVANGFLLLRNFRISESDNFPIIKEFLIPIVSEKVKITFIPSGRSSFGFVNAIELISAPKDLIADVAQLVDFEKNERLDGMLNNGFETVHRVNVGGFKVTPFNDTLWRTWVTDDEYLKSVDGSEKIHFGGQIKYQIGGASREVGPDNVYNTARVIKSSSDSIPNMNITWTFEVEKGYMYMVRTHFCDIASASTHMLYFNVYINGNLAYENLDLSGITNGLLASPFYADFVVNVENSSVLVVTVGPSNTSLSRAVDAILNGIEIWKMNNFMGSFDGEFCAEYALSSWKRARVDILLPLIGAVLLLITASMVMLRRRNVSVGWSRLPTDDVPESNLKG